MNLHIWGHYCQKNGIDDAINLKVKRASLYDLPRNRNQYP